MMYILFQGFLTLMNAFFAIDNYQDGRYKSAMFSSFICGVCFMGLIVAIIKL